MNQTPTLPELIKLIIESQLVDLHVSLPARVESYDSAKQKVSVKPLLKRGYLSEEGQRLVEGLPVINEVPVAFQSAGDFGVTFPLKAGDTVLLIFSEASLDKWLALGGEVDPGDDRHHTLSDAIAVPGLRPFNKPNSQVADDALVVHAPEVRLGSKDADEPVALKKDLDALKDLITVWSPAPSDGGASLKQLLTVGTGGNGPWNPTGAQKVKAE